MGLDAVERGTRFGVNFDGDEFDFVSKGARQSLVRLQPGEYRTKIEGNFNRIRRLNGKDGEYWEITNKRGVRFWFGTDDSSREEEGLHVFRWALDRIEDSNGNFVRFTYTKDRQQLYLDPVEYSGSDYGIPPDKCVLFRWEAVPVDVPEMFNTGFEVETAKRLKIVDVGIPITGECSDNGPLSLIRRYELSYETSSVTDREGYRANFNQNFVVLRNGLFHVHDLDNVRESVSRIGGGFHWRSPATPTWSLDRMCDRPSMACD